MERFDDELLDDDLDRLSEEMEGQNYRVYTRLNDLAWTKKNGVTKSTKKEIQSHLLKYSFSAEWFQRGEKLWQKAKAEQAKKAEHKLMPYFYISDYQDTDEVNHLAEYWEHALMNKNATSQLNKYGGWYTDLRPDWCRGHRGGIKRDKFALWASREKPTRHKRIKLAKLAKRQPAQQSVQQ